MGVLPSDEAVVIRAGQRSSDPTVITINCPDKMGLGCDIARVVFEFGLNLTRGDLSTDGRWCLVVLWVVPRMTASKPFRWSLLRKRLTAICPSPENQLFAPIEPPSKRMRIFLLQVYSIDRCGLLHDMSQILWELELTIHKVKVSTCPDGKIIDLFIISDNKGLLPVKERTKEVCDCVKRVAAGGVDSRCEIEEAGDEYVCVAAATSASSPPPWLSQLLISETNLTQHEIQVKVNIDNLLSPSHTLLQIECNDRKGLLYDCLRTLKDLKYKVAYGRLWLCAMERGKGEIDVFVSSEDGKKIVDVEKKRILCDSVKREIEDPVKVMVVGRGPDTEVLVATPIESTTGAGRPRVLYDVTLALKMLDICIFQADIGRQRVKEKQWEIYRFVLIDSEKQSLSSARVRQHIGERVKNVLMG